MKKIIIFTIIAAMLFCTFGCKSETDDEKAFSQDEIVIQDSDSADTEEESVPKDNTGTQNQQSNNNEQENKKPSSQEEKDETTDTQQQEKAPDYKKTKCQSIQNSAWQSIRISGEDKVTLQFDLPNNWVLTKSGEKYNINIGQKQIGVISSSAFDTPKDKFETKSGYDKDKELVSFRQVSWYKNESRDKIYREFQFVSDQANQNFTINIQVDYEQLDDSASDKLFSSAFTVPAFVNTEFVPLSKCNGSKKILILGNSFIGTSQVGAFLNDMVKNDGLTVNAISRGHAKISNYVQDSAICNAIQNGEYCYVFISGFYGEAQNVEHFGTLLDICKKSNTKLVLFPFHNDTDGYINETKLKYTDAIFLDWKGEINSLISSGKVTRNDMCQNDTYGHSTQLAGYVGAHMIYRNMFGKVPPAINNSPLSMSAVRAKLTDYVDTYKKVEVSKPSDFKGKTYTI